MSVLGRLKRLALVALCSQDQSESPVFFFRLQHHRPAKDAGRVESLVSLLKDIAESSKLLSRTHCVSLADGPGRRSDFNLTFDKYAGKGAEYVSAESVKQELEEFRKRSVGCETYADRLVAHLDKHAVKALPTFKEFYDAVDFAEDLLKKYTL